MLNDSSLVVTSALRVIMLDLLEDLVSFKYFPEPSRATTVKTVNFKEASTLRKSNLSIVLFIMMDLEEKVPLSVVFTAIEQALVISATVNIS